LGALVAATLLGSCTGRETNRDAFVVASLPPLGALVRMVAGPEVPVVVFLSANGNPHDFEPTPGDAGRVAGAVLVVTADPRLDSWMRRTALAVAGPQVPVLTMSDSTPGIPDPHTWLDPPTVLAFIPVLGESLAAVFPAFAPEIRERARLARARLAETDEEIRLRLGPVADAPFVLQLPAFVNFAKHYGLRLTGVIQTCPEEEPRPGAFARAITELGDAGGRVVFAHEGVSRSAADALALDLGGRVTLLDPFGAGLESYSALWSVNAGRMVEALSRGRD
jgi:ABC-type Zn uptake system ZnuABC Zn-binding protein ZnuA